MANLALITNAVKKTRPFQVKRGGMMILTSQGTQALLKAAKNRSTRD